MSSKPLVEVALILTGPTLVPSQVTAIVGLKPTKVWLAGDRVQATDLRRKECGWVYGLPQKESYDLDEVLCELFGVIEPHKTGIVTAINEQNLKSRISFGVYIKDETPAQWFSADTVRRIADIEAELDIDLILTE
jgi:hypothetical protein